MPDLMIALFGTIPPGAAGHGTQHEILGKTGLVGFAFAVAVVYIHRAESHPASCGWSL
jgi:hypothetical protein